MSIATLAILAVLFFLTSVIGVVTGSNSLITVPVMFQFGIAEKEAVATNMFGLVFMAIGGTIPFVRKRAIDFRRTSPLVVMTIVSSAIGAALVGFITNESIKLIVSIAMIVVAVFTLIRTNAAPDIDSDREDVADESSDGATLTFAFADRATQDSENLPPRPRNLSTAPTQAGEFKVPNRRRAKLFIVGYGLTFLLGIYGGLYSGGYVTILTAVFVAFLGMGFGEAVAATKWVNVFSSGVATLVFMWQGLVNYKLGILLGIMMFAGAYVGAHYAAKMNDLWLRRIFLTTVFILALKTLFDFV